MHRVVTAEQLEPVERREVDSFESKEELREVDSFEGKEDPSWNLKRIYLSGLNKTIFGFGDPC